MSDDALLSVRNLCVEFVTDAGIARAVGGVDIDVPRGATVALVGESGCGKSATALAIMNLIAPPGNICAGTISFEGRNLRTISSRAYRELRGGQIAMIFQEPMTSLNPVVGVGRQIVEAVRLHQSLNRREAWKCAITLLTKVGIASPSDCVRRFAHQLSGGMRQRVMIAMALAGRPALLLADEPTTALDVTTQAQILNLLRTLQRDTGMSMILITHDLGVAAQMADYLYVMYAGRIVEHAAAATLLARPRHPYTQGLLACAPRLGSSRDRLEAIPGSVPDPLNFPPGCRFHPRCGLGRAEHDCQTRDPPLELLSDRHRAACWKASGDSL